MRLARITSDENIALRNTLVSKFPNCAMYIPNSNLEHGFGEPMLIIPETELDTKFLKILPREPA